MRKSTAWKLGLVLAAGAMLLSSQVVEAKPAGPTAEVRQVRYLGTVDVATIRPSVFKEKIRIVRAPLPGPSRDKSVVPPEGTLDGGVARSGEINATTPLAAATLVQSFEGIGASGLEPPDPHIAVGPNDVILATNAGLRVYNRSGQAITNILDPSDFFGVPPAYEIQSDPKVLYDAESGRFYAVWIGFDQQANVGAWFVAVSTTNSAAGSFVRYEVQEPGNLPDYPGLGICSDKLVITANDFRLRGLSFVFNSAVAVALNKADLIAGAASPATNRFPGIQLSGGAGAAFTMQPVHSLTPTSSCNLISLRTTSSVQLYKIDGTPPSATFATGAAVNLTRTLSEPPDARQSGSNTLVVTNDTRLLDATYRGVNGGSVWASSTTGCRFGGRTTFSCANVLEVQNVDGATPSLRQQVVLGASGQFFYFPALRTDVNNNMTVIFSASSSTTFPSLRYTSYLSSKAPGTLEPSATLVNGSVAYTGTRWGDYQGAALDPVDNRSIWIYGEYKRATSPFWQTFAGQTLVP